MSNVFKFTYLAFLVSMALVVGGASYQTVSITPAWQEDFSLFNDYGHWGVGYFPILSPLMTVLWLALVIMGFRQQFPGKKLFYVGHLFILLIMGTTFLFFAPFLLDNMGKAVTGEAVEKVRAELDIWAKWDRIRQLVGLIPLAIYIYCYRLSGEGVRSVKA